jgi:hypothetical protein
LRAAAECLWAPLGRWEIEEGFAWAEAAIAALPPDLAAQVERAIQCNDSDMRVKVLEDIADALDQAAVRATPAKRTHASDSAKRQRRQSQPRIHIPDGLRTVREAAARLGCSIKTLNGHIDSGALRYVNIGHGEKRPRKMFTDADLDALIAAQTRKESPCPSTASRARHSGTSISSGEVVAFTARPKSRPGVKPKK